MAIDLADSSKSDLEQKPQEIEFLAMFYRAQQRMAQKNYEQELYEKYQYIPLLENERGELGLEVKSDCSEESTQ